MSISPMVSTMGLAGLVLNKNASGSYWFLTTLPAWAPISALIKASRETAIWAASPWMAGGKGRLDTWGNSKDDPKKLVEYLDCSRASANCNALSDVVWSKSTPLPKIHCEGRESALLAVLFWTLPKVGCERNFRSRP